MATPEDIKSQLELLKVNRETLQHYLSQRDTMGSAYVPPVVTHGIQESRKNIRQIKATLQSWGIAVEEFQIDEDNSFSIQNGNKTQIHRQKKTTLILGYLVIIVAGFLVGAFVLGRYFIYPANSIIFAVDSNTDWANSTVFVKTGDLVKIKYLSGKWAIYKENEDFVDAAGYPGKNLNRYVEGAPVGSLIARIGNESPFLVGQQELAFIAKTSGSLSFRINDGILGDNLGNLVIQIIVNGN